MIISRTPLRISFFGGGTDYPAWYDKNGGAVLSASIDKYCYITCRYLPPFFDYKHRIRYYKREETKSIDEIEHPSVRECLKFRDIKDGVEIVHHADLPAQSGLGSSSSFTVGLLKALYALKNQMVSKRQLALEAINVEQKLIKENVGSQDQTCAAFGGFNHIEFGGIQEIAVQPIMISQEKLALLQNHFMLFFSGFPRTASSIAGEQIRLIPQKKKYLKKIQKITEEIVHEFQNNNHMIDDFGKLLHEQWIIKRELSPLISNKMIDDIYEAGLSAGADGGKLLGAGSGGFILFYVKEEHRAKLLERFKDLLYVPFRFDFTGSQIIYYSQNT